MRVAGQKSATERFSVMLMNAPFLTNYLTTQIKTTTREKLPSGPLKDAT
jgi:hypothetical protein